MSSTFDLITIGDSTIDTFIKVNDALLECDLSTKDCKICFPYGSKIPVDAIDYGVAGNAANVVIGCKKLGLDSAIYTNLGNDDQGKRIKEAFEKSGVAPDYVKVSADKTTNLSVVLTFQGERTIFVYHQDWDYELPKLADTKWIYLTSMAQTFTSSNIMDDICHYLDRSRAKLVFSPGTFQLKANVKRYPRVLEKCEVIIVNKEEALNILEINNKENIPMRDILTKLIMLGPKIAVVTDGVEGSYATDGQRFLKAGIVPVRVSEKTGAGDAYSAGLVAGLFNGEDLSEAMVWGTINASSVVSRLTTQGGQLSYDEIKNTRKNMKDFQVVNI
jgi:sugar/nucleoside kinase (ribokinase family)